MDQGRRAAVLLALLLAGCGSLPTELDEKPGIDRVYERRRTADQVERVSETFVGAEPESGSDAVFLSHPGARAGYEFGIVLDSSLDLPEGSLFRLECVFREGQPPIVRSFPITRRPGWFFGEYLVRLTGPDDPGANVRPIAWRLSVLGPDGALLAARHSFLWGAPADLEPR